MGHCSFQKPPLTNLCTNSFNVTTKCSSDINVTNESGEWLLEMCAEQELVVGNSWFKKNDVYKYTWLRMAEGRVVDNALMDYVLLPRRMVGRLLDVKVWRGKGIV